MPVPLTYPGVYIEEVPSGVRTITSVANSIAALSEVETQAGPPAPAGPAATTERRL